MSLTMNERSYRRAAIDGASSVALVIMLYDRLVADMQRAVTAMRVNDIETRCAQLKHALLVLQQLEGSLDHEQGGQAARNLEAFYSYARAQVMEAQLKRRPELLEKLIRHILEVRSAWQQLNSRGTPFEKSSQFLPEQAQEQPQSSFTGESLLSCTV